MSGIYDSNGCLTAESASAVVSLTGETSILR